MSGLGERVADGLGLSFLGQPVDLLIGKVERAADDGDDHEDQDRNRGKDAADDLICHWHDRHILLLTQGAGEPANK